MNNAMTAAPAAATLARFIEYADDAANWSGSPLIGGNVGGEPADKGFIVNMKKAGLITTEIDSDDPSCVWMSFTSAGVALAAEHGCTGELFEV